MYWGNETISILKILSNVRRPYTPTSGLSLVGRAVGESAGEFFEELGKRLLRRLYHEARVMGYPFI